MYSLYLLLYSLRAFALDWSVFYRDAVVFTVFVLRFLPLRFVSVVASQNSLVVSLLSVPVRQTLL